MAEGEPILQFNGVFCLLKEAFKVISSRKILISLQTLVFVLPLSMLKLFYIHIQDQSVKDDSVFLILFMIAYSLFNFIYSLPSTTAVIHTIKCIDEAKEVSFKSILSEIPKSSNRIATLGYFYTTIIYFQIALCLDYLFMLIWYIDTWTENDKANGYLFLVLLSVCFAAYAWMYFRCILIHTVTVAEGTYATHVKEKIENEHVCKILIRGRMWAASAIVLVVHFSLITIEMTYIGLFIHGKSEHTVLKILCGFACCILLSIQTMFGLILQSLVYFVSVPRAVIPVDDV